MVFGRDVATMVHVLFNLYFCAMVDDWRKHCPQAGVNFHYHHGHKLVGDYSYSQVAPVEIFCYLVQICWCCCFICYLHEDFELVASSFVSVAKLWCLTVSLVKSEDMVVGTGADAIDKQIAGSVYINVFIIQCMWINACMHASIIWLWSAINFLLW